MKKFILILLVTLMVSMFACAIPEENIDDNGPAGTVRTAGDNFISPKEGHVFVPGEILTIMWKNLPIERETIVNIDLYGYNSGQGSQRITNIAEETPVDNPVIGWVGDDCETFESSWFVIDPGLYMEALIDYEEFFVAISGEGVPEIVSSMFKIQPVRLDTPAVKTSEPTMWNTGETVDIIFTGLGMEGEIETAIQLRGVEEETGTHRGVATLYNQILPDGIDPYEVQWTVPTNFYDAGGIGEGLVKNSFYLQTETQVGSSIEYTQITEGNLYIEKGGTNPPNGFSINVNDVDTLYTRTQTSPYYPPTEQHTYLIDWPGELDLINGMQELTCGKISLLINM